MPVREMNEVGQCRLFAPELVAMQNEGQIRDLCFLRSQTYSTIPENLVKIAPVNPEIIGLHGDR